MSTVNTNNVLPADAMFREASQISEASSIASETRARKLAAATSTLDDGLRFPFMKLSPEIRRRVYFFAVVNRRPTLINGKGKQKVKPPLLLKANRETRDVAGPLFYKNNHFTVKARPRFDKKCPFKSWTRRIGEHNSKHLLRVTIFLTEAERVYLALIIRADGQFPKGVVKLEWSEMRNVEERNPALSFFIKKFKDRLKQKYPDPDESGAIEDNSPYEETTDDVVSAVDEIFALAKEATSEPFKGSGKGMSKALWGGSCW